MMCRMKVSCNATTAGIRQVSANNYAPVFLDTDAVATSSVMCRVKVPCDAIAGGILQVSANDYAQVFVNSNIVATSWRRMPFNLSIPTSSCNSSIAGGTAILEILVQAMGRDNFFAFGTAESASKGILQPVLLFPGMCSFQMTVPNFRPTH